MDELLKFYTKTFSLLAGSLVALVLLVPTLVPRLEQLWGKSHWVLNVAHILTSRLFVVSVLAGGAWITRKWLWKVVHPELNFQGEWEGESTYAKIELGPQGTLPPPAKHEVRFAQDCLSFAIAPTAADDYANWGSLAVSLADKDTIRYAYYVNYRNPAWFPARAQGYEDLKVTKRGARERPEELTGVFYHCAMGYQPVYSGTVVFKRKDK